MISRRLRYHIPFDAALLPAHLWPGTLNAARSVLDAATGSTDGALQMACEVVLALSADHTDRQRATDLIRTLKD